MGMNMATSVWLRTCCLRTSFLGPRFLLPKSPPTKEAVVIAKPEPIADVRAIYQRQRRDALTRYRDEVARIREAEEVAVEEAKARNEEWVTANAATILAAQRRRARDAQRQRRAQKT